MANKRRCPERGWSQAAPLAILCAVVLMVSTCGTVPAGAGEPLPLASETVRDRLWVFTCVAGSDDDFLKRANFPRMSRMTPAESAFYLNVPNLMMIRWQGKPEAPFDQTAIPFRPLNQLVWSLVDSDWRTNGASRNAAFELAARCRNLTGFIMDDFFTRSRNGEANLSLDELRDLRRELVINGRRRDLFVVVYYHNLNRPIKPYLELCDKITYWTWQARDLTKLEQGFQRLEELVPDRPKLLGCYFWDYGSNRPMPLELMQKQCRVGLEWLRAGRIEGLIFLGNTVCDLDLPAVEWTRKWIAEVGEQPIVTKSRHSTQ